MNFNRLALKLSTGLQRKLNNVNEFLLNENTKNLSHSWNLQSVDNQDLFWAKYKMDYFLFHFSSDI